MSESQPLSESEKHCRLRLARTQNIGPVTFRALINQFGNGTDALAALPELAAKGGRSRALKICPKSKADADADAEWEAASAIGATLHFLGNTDYPKPLVALEDAPHSSAYAAMPLCCKRKRSQWSANAMHRSTVSASLGKLPKDCAMRR
jgi:DNA processing protein